MSEENSFRMSRAWRLVIVVLALAVVVSAGAALRERTSAMQLASQNDRTAGALRDTQAQVQLLTEKINAMAAAPPPAPAPAPTMVVVSKSAKHGGARRAKEDPRWKKMQSRIDEQGKQLDEYGKQIDATRQDLTSARTELQGSIARTHDELVVLQKKGERSYYEFDLDKAKQFHAQGPVGLRLRKADAKHQFADLEMMVDDVRVSQKHVNLLQPVIFYAGEGGRPVEIVVNRISKNHIHGYVSEPKYRTSELASASPAASTDNAQAQEAPNPPARRKLSLPK
jgi:hypothetical protein